MVSHGSYSLPSTRDRSDASRRRTDVALSTRLLLQGFTLFLVIPFAGSLAIGQVLLDVCHFSFALVCIVVLSRHRDDQLALLIALLLLVAGPVLVRRLGDRLLMDYSTLHELIAGAAFAFNGGVTALVARHVFAPGRVTVHSVRGAVLLYLTVAALFAIAYGAIAMHLPGAFSRSPRAGPPDAGAFGNAAFSYFSLAMITTTG